MWLCMCWIPRKNQRDMNPSAGCDNRMIANALAGVKDSPTEPEVELTTDEVFHLLSNSRRRSILLILMDNGFVDKRELTERVAEREYETDRSDLSSSDKQSIRVSLHQNHLPRLEDAEVINVDRSTISIGPNASELKQHIKSDSLIRRFVDSLR